MCFSIQIDQNINKLSALFKAQIHNGKMLERERLFRLQSEMESREFDEQLGIKHSEKKRSTPFKMPAEDGKVFSNYFANVIVSEKNDRVIAPMRYRVRPAGSKEEIPTKFNVFNARLDALESRVTWNSLFGKQHGIVPIKKFYEWVEGPTKKPTLISFFPEAYESMWAPVLYDEWISKNGTIHFKSFAIITDGPAPEIESMGHDRCPIFLRQDMIDEWLNPIRKTKKELYQILNLRESAFYQHEWV